MWDLQARNESMKQNSHTDADAIDSTTFVIVMDNSCFHLLVRQLFE